MLASGANDRTVRLWDAASGQPLGGPLTRFAGTVTSVAFSPDGRRLAAGRGDGTIRLWDDDLRAWPSRACRIANRHLTRRAWRQYLSDLPYHKPCPDLPA